MINAYLYIDNKKYRLLNLFFNFSQSLGINNKPRSIPRGGQLQLTIPAVDKDLELLNWTIHSTMQKKGRIEIMARDGGSIGFKMEFANAYATSATYIYNSDSSEPMNYTIMVTAGILRINGDNDTIHKQTWDDGTAFDEQAASVIKKEGQKTLTSYFITDKDNNKINDFNTGDFIILNIGTLNRVGDIVSINLNNNEHDFKYKGTFLENDRLENISITSDLQKIELEVTEQK